MSKIDSFSGKYRFLSNFYPAKVVLDGFFYKTTEHAYQAAKTLDEFKREQIRLAETAGEAKKLGQKVKLRHDWDEVKIEVMTDLVRQKFQNEPLKNKLLETGDAELIEGNTWGDVFWGVCNGVGKNNLGKVLMRVRQELK
jgi:ribA/ribD-fused uncharacterized protein